MRCRNGMKVYTDFFVTFSVFRCYIVERDKMPVEKVDRTAASGAEDRKGGMQMWIMRFY